MLKSRYWVWMTLSFITVVLCLLCMNCRNENHRPARASLVHESISEADSKFADFAPPPTRDLLLEYGHALCGDLVYIGSIDGRLYFGGANWGGYFESSQAMLGGQMPKLLSGGESPEWSLVASQPRLPGHPMGSDPDLGSLCLADLRNYPEFGGATLEGAAKLPQYLKPTDLGGFLQSGLDVYYVSKTQDQRFVLTCPGKRHIDISTLYAFPILQPRTTWWCTHGMEGHVARDLANRTSEIVRIQLIEDTVLCLSFERASCLAISKSGKAQLIDLRRNKPATDSPLWEIPCFATTIIDGRLALLERSAKVDSPATALYRIRLISVLPSMAHPSETSDHVSASFVLPAVEPVSMCAVYGGLVIGLDRKLYFLAEERVAGAKNSG